MQEEPRNQGAWAHVETRMGSVLEMVGGVGRRLRYVGRKEDAVPAVGVGKVYKAQQSEIIKGAFEGV